MNMVRGDYIIQDMNFGKVPGGLKQKLLIILPVYIGAKEKFPFLASMCNMYTAILNDWSG
jgi:hypothetical protein